MQEKHGGQPCGDVSTTQSRPCPHTYCKRRCTKEVLGEGEECICQPEDEEAEDKFIPKCPGKALVFKKFYSAIL